MVDRFLDCAKPLVAQLEGLPGRINGSTDTEKLYQFCCDFKKTLVEFLVDAGFYNCSVAKELATVACPGTDWKKSVQTLVRLSSEFLRHCLCAALLPPCPEPVYDDCVPLATITVQRTDNSIKNICTWDTRRFAVTLQTSVIGCRGCQSRVYRLNRCRHSAVSCWKMKKNLHNSIKNFLRRSLATANTLTRTLENSSKR